MSLKKVSIETPEKKSFGVGGGVSSGREIKRSVELLQWK